MTVQVCCIFQPADGCCTPHSLDRKLLACLVTISCKTNYRSNANRYFTHTFTCNEIMLPGMKSMLRAMKKYAVYKGMLDPIIISFKLTTCQLSTLEYYNTL